MRTWRMATSPSHRPTARRRLWTLVVALIVTLAAASVVFDVHGRAAARQAPAKAGLLPGMASLSGTVDGTKPFKAAQVFIRNVDKHILYMVFTNAGRFRAVDLFPGNYEIDVQVKGQQSEVQKLVVKAGDSPSLKLSMHNAANPMRPASAFDDFNRGLGAAEGMEPGHGGPALTFGTYDEVWPPGPGREVYEQACMTCHGENHAPARPASQAEWQRRIDYMMGKFLWDHDKKGLGEGFLAPAASFTRLGLQDRKDLLAYLVKNFGPTAKPQAVRTIREMPLDEAKLGKAMYMEYYTPLDPPGQGTHSPDYEAFKSERLPYTVGGFDRDGNVWSVDRGYPNKIIKLDPRTGVQKDYIIPDPKGGTHELIIDREGIIWVPEWTGTADVKDKHIFGFNPKTEKWEYDIDSDPEDIARTSIQGLHSIALDSKGNLYSGMMLGGALSKWEKATGKTSVFRLPVLNGFVYGVTIDSKDNVFLGLWSGTGIMKFDTTTNMFTMFTPSVYPVHIRRPGVDSKDNVWFGIFNGGSKREGKLAKLDQRTGRITEWSIPYQNSQPYYMYEDAEGNIWFPDSPAPDRAGALGKFNPKDETFAFYPRPQFAADCAKVQATRDGAVWYVPKGYAPGRPGMGVLYPDMDRITTFGAYYLNGPPGYSFNVTTSTRAGSR